MIAVGGRPRFPTEVCILTYHKARKYNVLIFKFVCLNACIVCGSATHSVEVHVLVFQDF